MRWSLAAALLLVCALPAGADTVTREIPPLTAEEIADAQTCMTRYNTYLHELAICAGDKPYRNWAHYGAWRYR
jgi:hypothetical protein